MQNINLLVFIKLADSIGVAVPVRDRCSYDRFGCSASRDNGVPNGRRPIMA